MGEGGGNDSDNIISSCYQLDHRGGGKIETMFDNKDINTKNINHNSHLPPRYNWNIVESGVKHHQTNKQQQQLL